MKMKRIPVKKTNVSVSNFENIDFFPRTGGESQRLPRTQAYNDTLLSSYREVLEMVDSPNGRKNLAKNLLRKYYKKHLTKSLILWSLIKILIFLSAIKFKCLI